MAMIKTKMTQEEFQGKLTEHGMTASEACTMVFHLTEAVIPPREVHHAFDRHGTLSGPMTAVFRFLFKALENAKTKTL